MTLPVSEPAAARHAAVALVRDHPGAFALTLALTALSTVAGLGAPYLLGRIVDVVQVGGDVTWLALLIVACALAQLVLTRFTRHVGGRFGERVAAAVRERFLERVLALPAALVARVSTGDLTTRATGDVSTVAATLRSGVPELLVAAVQAAFVLVAVLVVNPLLGACGVVGLFGIVVVLRWYLRRARSAYLAAAASTSRLAEVLVSTAAGARTVEALGLQRRRIDAVVAAIEDSRTHVMRTLSLRTVLYPVLDVSAVLPLVGILLVGGALYDDGVLGLGAVVTCAMYVRQLTGPLETLSIWLEQLQSSTASFARLEGLVAVHEPRPSAPATPAGDRIEVSGLSFAYTAGRDVLSGIDLRVRPGEHLAIVGPSGAGKSTLGRLLAGLERPRVGSVTVGGVAVADLPPDVLREHIVLVTQEQHVFRDTVRGNLLLARPTATDDDLRAALHAVGAHWVDDLPHGLDTELGRSAFHLDAARAQELALSRVVLADPHTLVLDEATAMLDPTAARSAERALAAVLAGRTVIAIAHRLHTAHDADRIIVLRDGRLAELGTHTELVNSGGDYADLWRTWHGAGAAT
ncbi:ABC transporter ATP-binding protein [Kutzneria buriramensis]|uniref:ABC-type multidrug transport system fused ATPase/permease subunit n=1 Tax=Kutzneria buriramensis TaxID=1045776 RepID=A0A3E0HLD2_9PSEU|nr:ABC transporter ATP-binding protein [Kutzneria buriramensis]REH47274.1 ABC-type multidrug transport system fused ATPase/permease subunit [Kutzneria buriramensis]